MCSPEAAMATLKVASAFAGYEDKKTKYRTTQASNTIAKKNASRGLHDDYGYIDYQKGEARADVTEIDGNVLKSKDEKTANIVKNKIEKINAMAKQLNLNVGNSGAILKDIGAEYQLVEQDNDREFGIDMQTAYRQYDKAYASFTQAMNNLPVPQEPSWLGLAVDMTGAGMQYRRDQKTLS